MSNRQARREQSRTSRQTRPTRAARPSSGGGGGSRGGGPDLFSLPYLAGLGAVVLVFVAVLAFVMMRGGDDNEDIVRLLEESHAAFPADLAKGAAVGKDDAPIKLEQYEDFQCPFCLKYTSEQEGQIIEEYVKTGKVQIIYRHFPGLGTESLRAAIGSYCAGEQDRFWDYKYELFHIQAEAGQLSAEKLDAGRYSDDKLKQIAKDLELDTAKFDQCFGGTAALKAVEDDQRAGRAIGIRGTPSFAINGLPMGASGAPADMADWRKILDDAITAVTASPTPEGAAAASPSPAATASPTSGP